MIIYGQVGSWNDTRGGSLAQGVHSLELFMKSSVENTTRYNSIIKIARRSISTFWVDTKGLNPRGDTLNEPGKARTLQVFKVHAAHGNIIYIAVARA